MGVVSTPRQARCPDGASRRHPKTTVRFQRGRRTLGESPGIERGVRVKKRRIVSTYGSKATRCHSESHHQFRTALHRSLACRICRPWRCRITLELSGQRLTCRREL